VGEQIDAAVKMWRRDFGKYSLIAFAVTLPIALITFAYQSDKILAINSQGQALVLDVDAYNQTIYLLLGLSLLGAMFTFGALFHAMTRARIMKPWTVTDSMKGALRRIIPFVALGIVTAVLMVLGFFALVIPGLVIAVSLSIAPAGFWAEGIGPFAAVRRAWVLVSGLRWKVFGILFVAVILQVAFALVIAPLLFTSVSPDDKTMYLLVNSVASPVLSALVNPLIPAVLTVSYYDARVRKEGLDIELAAGSLGGMSPGSQSSVGEPDSSPPA
jgi:hypothetical protein